MQKTLLLLAFVFLIAPAVAEQPAVGAAGKFRQLGTMLPTPNVYRNAAGAPGHGYWQQRADYKIDVRLDETAYRVSASETITYTNESPDRLSYLWLQLDQNRFNAGSIERRSEAAQQNSETEDSAYSFSRMRRDQAAADKEYGYAIENVKSGNRTLPYTIVDTMMRIDLKEPLAPGGEIVFSVDWSFNVVEQDAFNARGGYEYFAESDTYLYYLAQWFPRLVAYTDYTAWQHKQFLGRGEFTLEFGNYEVAITVPADHVVSATGELQNPEAVLSDLQRQRLATARREKREPVFIVTPEEAKANEQDRARGTKTWRFAATNVRDFAFASSRKFIWDAMIHEQDDAANPKVLAMSFYPNEAEPIWSRYSTHAVVHTMGVYSRFSFPYPYPTSQSVNTWKGGGMEYPMITFNGYRPELTEVNEDDKQFTYSRSIKQSLIGVIIHEVGHNYFPMTVNSDERQWTWMDEGLNSFLQYVAEREWEEDFHEAEDAQSLLDHVGEYMLSEKQVPIMTQSDSILQFGPNAYTKPAAALMVLRETVMGRELFDFAFREYSRRWMFKRPTPADFFRTLEDASAVDLDWFWRGWFYGTDHVDIALTRVREFQVSTLDPDIELEKQRMEVQREQVEPLIQKRNREEGIETYVKDRPELEDFYNEHDKFTPSNKDRNAYREFIDGLEDWERAALERAVNDADYIYFLDFANLGGLVSPLPLAITYGDGSTGSYDIPAEIWRRSPDVVTKVLISAKRIIGIELDPLQQTADTDRGNNYFPQRIVPSRLELYKRDRPKRDLMADMLADLKAEKDDEKPVPLRPSN